MLNFFHRIGILPERRAEYEAARLSALRSAREAAAERYASAGHGERTEAAAALQRATNALMRAELYSLGRPSGFMASGGK